MRHFPTVLLLLRIGIAVVFLYAAVAATLQPFNWIGYIPPVLRAIFPADLLLMGFSGFQVLLALWVLSGWKTLYAASLAAITFVAILVVNIGQIDIVFRDIAIFFAAVALAVGSTKK